MRHQYINGCVKTQGNETEANRCALTAHLRGCSVQNRPQQPGVRPHGAPLRGTAVRMSGGARSRLPHAASWKKSVEHVVEVPA